MKCVVKIEFEFDTDFVSISCVCYFFVCFAKVIVLLLTPKVG